MKWVKNSWLNTWMEILVYIFSPEFYKWQFSKDEKIQDKIPGTVKANQNCSG